MIGQKKLLFKIDEMINNNNFPRFTIIHGNNNSGRKTISKYIATKLNARLIISGIKVDDIREIISLAYKQSEPTVYLLPGIDKMSIQAKNALLKITEEPPKKSYFILTLMDINNLLPTLISRASILAIDPYSKEDLLDYIDYKKYQLTNEQEAIILDICNDPGEIDLLYSYNIIDFYNYIEIVIDNIATVTGPNAFKIGLKLKFKEEDEGWDITLFLKAVMNIYNKKIIIEPLVQYKDSIITTSKYLAETKINGINKSYIIDMWILDIRQIWLN